ncbi:MAG: hypothetical protein HY814_00360, partial [Candidatus Riflebacteria bacterium]|nr:hypothetical protein [Candidatus Riflebacteria bacterium]
MRCLLVILIAYALLQGVTSVDAVLGASWFVLVALGGLSWTGRWKWRLVLQGALWLRIWMTVPLYYYWGRAPDVVLPGLATAVLAYGLWTAAGGRRLTFAVALSLPLGVICYLKLALIDVFFPAPFLAAKVTGSVTVPAAELPAGWGRYHCPGYSIGVPLGMTSGFMGTGQNNTFAYYQGRSRDETLSALVMIFPRLTAFETDPDVAPMAAQILGITRELPYARYVLSAHDGHTFLSEKLQWLGLRPPERIEELHLKDASGFLLSDTRVNWYRARLYFPIDGKDFQADLWLYGDGPLLTRERVLGQLSTWRLELRPNHRPTLDVCRELARRGADREANLALNSLL